ncbi:MAG: hypothetical protein Q7U35_05630 [Methanobacteriaceae archaeon]|nr:hypothetical protein [Methanobacteriaceae archaeon]MDP2835394.1 hypothetical protein [Methanobacteriaceae archaeon]MDP3035040.1 hypothetical protein [Methanobacteriaceae archaeon]MDP3486043.1 hypothetical protein [Methanobacteriaceae archaeon]MDP3623642.1 hypothetical protein [Methanobacteriaceae archaeon]
MKLIKIKDEDLFKECIACFFDKLNIILTLLGLIITSTIGITAYYKEQPLVNFFINILVVLGFYYLILTFLLLKLYKNKLKLKKLEETKKKEPETEPDPIAIGFAPSLFRERYKKW